MHCNESRGYPVAEVGEESACSIIVAFDLSDPKSWKLQGQDVELLGLYCVAFYIIVLASSSCLYHSPSRTWDSTSGHSFHCSCLACT